MENKAKLHELAEFLYMEETITGEQFMAILKEKINTVHDLSITRGRMAWLSYLLCLCLQTFILPQAVDLEIKAIYNFKKSKKLQNFYGKLYIFMIRYHGVQ